MNALKNMLRLIGSTLVLGLFVQNVQSAVLIDGFTDSQYLIDGILSSDLDGNNVISDLGITDTLLGNMRRTLHADSASTEVDVDGGFLTIMTDSASAASVRYSFDPIDLSAFAQALSLNISFIDLNVEIQMIANGTSVFGFHDFGGVGQYWIDFSQFTIPSAFTQLTSLELRFHGPQAWDAEFMLLATDTKVPEPSVTALLFIGMIGIGMVARRNNHLA